MILIFGFYSCYRAESIPINKRNIQAEVKSILLYRTIDGYTKDSIYQVLENINEVIYDIDSLSRGYSLWEAEPDSLGDYGIFIEGHWSDSLAYEVIHADSSFRAVLDRHLDVLAETRKWDFYQRFSRYKGSY